MLALPDAFGVFPFAVGAIGLASFQLSRRLSAKRANEAQWAAQKSQDQSDGRQEQHIVPPSPKASGKGKPYALTSVPLMRTPPQRDTTMEKLAAKPDPDPLMARLTKAAGTFALFAPPFFIVVAMTTPGVSSIYPTGCTVIDHLDCLGSYVVLDHLWDLQFRTNPCDFLVGKAGTRGAS